ncbi:Uncharacterised protein [Collinsella intestinalis]|nr:Uncharacterised protein [Collinsella intestinalis]
MMKGTGSPRKAVRLNISAMTAATTTPSTYSETMAKTLPRAKNAEVSRP